MKRVVKPSKSASKQANPSQAINRNPAFDNILVRPAVFSQAALDALDDVDETPANSKQKLKSLVCKCCQEMGKERAGFRQFHLMDADGIYLTSYLTTAKEVALPRVEDILPPEAFDTNKPDGNFWEQIRNYQVMVSALNRLMIPRRHLLSAMSAAHDDFIAGGGQLKYRDGKKCELPDPDVTFGTCDCETFDCKCGVFDGKCFDVIKKVDDHGAPLHITANKDRILWVLCVLALTHPHFLTDLMLK